VRKETGVKFPYLIGTMIELPRACLTADLIAEEAEFFSFGTNDLTQTTYGFSRDDIGYFLPEYLDRNILPEDPFASLDVEGVGKLVAMGIEKGIHVEDPALDQADSSVYAKVLKKVFEMGDYDLILTGKQAQDTDNGQAGIMLAEYLGLPCVSNVIGIEVIDDTLLKVSRLGDAGTEIIELTLPAVVTVSDSINEPRLPQMRGIMMAKKKPIETMDLSALGLSVDDVGGAVPASEIVAFMESQTRAAGQKFEGDAAEITAKVVGLLADEANVI